MDTLNIGTVYKNEDNLRMKTCNKVESKVQNQSNIDCGGEMRELCKNCVIIQNFIKLYALHFEKNYQLT